MIDTSVIRANYANMLDTQLIHIAKNDAHELTPEAFQILQEEFKRRNLDYGYIEAAEENKTLIHQEKIQQVKDSVADGFLKSIWQYAIDEKANGTSDKEILTGLQEQGLDEAHASMILAGLKNRVKEIVDKQDTKMLAGGLTCTVGTLVTIATYSSATESGGYFVIAWGAIVFGAIRFFTGLSEKGKYKGILKKIELYEEDENDLINQE